MTLEEIETATEGQVVARRNVSLGLWAGRKIGLRGRALNAYVLEVIAADHKTVGPEDVIKKIARDFVIHGITRTDAEIGAELQAHERLAWQELGSTD